MLKRGRFQSVQVLLGGYLGYLPLTLFGALRLSLSLLFMPLRLVAISMCVLVLGSALDRTALAQEEHPDSTRKIVSRVVPIYPELARKMKLEGTVRLQATVAPNGTVKFVETVGGSPLLVKAAENAIYKWRWIPGKEESKELVEMRFHPE